MVNPARAITDAEIALDAVERDGNGVPALLLSYQQAWIADTSQVKLCEKSRRVGISWAEAADAALTACTARSGGGMNVYYLSYNQEMTQQFIRDCAFWIRVYGLAASEPAAEIVRDEDRDILTYVIRCASGFEIRALPSRATGLRSKQGKVILDEAAFVDDLEEVLKAAMALLMWGGRLAIISTHNGEDNPFNALIEECRAGKFPYAVHRFTFQDAVAQGLYRRICLTRHVEWTPEGEAEWVASVYAFYGDNAGEELDVVPSSGNAIYLPRSLIERCMDRDLAVLTWRCPDEFTYRPRAERERDCQQWCETVIGPEIRKLVPGHNKYYGSDFARVGDASIIAPGVEDEHLNVLVPFLIELRNVPFEQQQQVLGYVVGNLLRFMAGAMDANGNGAAMAEWAAQQYGPTRVAEVKPTLEWYRQNMPRLRAAFEDGTIRLPRHANVLADLRAVKKVKGVAKVPDDAREKGADGEMRHGDIAIALVMLLFAIAEMEPVPIEFASIGRRASLDVDLGSSTPSRPTTDAGWGTIAGGNDFGGY